MTSEANLDNLSPPERGREIRVSSQDLTQWRQQARQQAIAAAISPEEVDWLLQDLAGLDRQTLRLASIQSWPAVTLKLPLATLTAIWQQRLQQRVPVQYLTGIAPWRQFLLHVSPAVLIPRPETECLIDLAMAVSDDRHSPALRSGHWADLGTGSGAIALGLATAFPAATIHAVDISAAALAIARDNAQRFQLLDRIRFYQGSWLEPLAQLTGQLSGIVSNPPYIPSAMVLDLQPEVAQHEPHLALDGGKDGLDYIRHLVTTAPAYLRSGGVFLVEMMAGQAAVVQELLQQQGCYHSIQTHTDLARIDRFAVAYRV